MVKLNIRDGRGEHKEAERDKNRELVRKFFNDNPGAAIIECQRALHLSYPTVASHIKAIKGEQSNES